MQDTEQNNIFIPATKPQRHFYFMALKYLVTDMFLSKPKITKEKIDIKPGEIKMWMVGHATLLINFFGITILTDPVFTNWLPTKRLVHIGYNIKDLPKIDYVLISHAHMDHFSISSLKKLANTDTTLILPKNCSDLVTGMRYKEILEIGYGQTLDFEGLKISAHKAEHWGERYPWQRKGRGYNSYILKKEDKTIFFAGDTGYAPEMFKKLSTEKTDIALLPIGAYYPWNDYYKIHLDPKEAFQAFEELEAKFFIPIHFGNFRLSYEPLDEPPTLLAEIAAKKNMPEKIKILYNGQTFTLPI